MKRKHFIVSGLCLFAAVFVLGVAACKHTAASVQSKKLQVFAAVSLADAFKEIGTSFEAANSGVKVEFSFEGSNQLRVRMENGAKADVFVSADRKQMDAAVASKVVDGASLKTLAFNRLALIVPKENRRNIKELSDLAQDGLKIVVADKAVPAGNYTRQLLDKAALVQEFGAKFVTQVEANIVSREQNVGAVVAKVALNEADAGFAYASDAAGGSKDKIVVIAIPASLEQKAEYVMATTAAPADAALAGQFVAFLSSDAAKKTLADRGFSPVGSP